MPQGRPAALLDLAWLQAAVPALAAIKMVGPSFSLLSLQGLVSRPQVRLQQRPTDQLHKFRFNELFNSSPPTAEPAPAYGLSRLVGCQQSLPAIARH